MKGGLRRKVVAHDSVVRLAVVGFVPLVRRLVAESPLHVFAKILAEQAREILRVCGLAREAATNAAPGAPAISS